MKIQAIKDKICSVELAKSQIGLWQAAGEKVVFTNGCFDILHEGHVTYLAGAADCGTKLVLGLNTDASVRRQGKGEERPINPESARAIVLASLQYIDLVVLFEEDTPLEIIEQLQPDLVAKGADYDANETDVRSKKYIVGRDIVLAKGGEVKTIALVPGFSTTGIVKKLKGS